MARDRYVADVGYLCPGLRREPVAGQRATPIGRMVAAAVMMSGIAVLGVVTASIASWLVQRVEESTEAAAESIEEPLRAELAGLVTEIAALRREVAELTDRPTL